MNYMANEVAKITGLTVATLRYYEREGLLPKIKRNERNSRVYTQSDIEWIDMIICLRSADLPIREIKKYIALLAQGGITMNERMEIVKSYKMKLEEKINNMQTALTLVNNKLQFYSVFSKKENIRDLTYVDEWNEFKKMCEGD